MASIELSGTIKFSDKNIGRAVTVRGEKKEISWISSDKQQFRVAQGEGIPVIDYGIEDIDSVTGLVIDIAS